MSTVLIVYFSKSGNTESMAHMVAEGVKAEGVTVDVKRVNDVNVDELLAAKGVVIGSPTYFGAMAAEIKSFLDESVKHFGKLKGKVGGAFSSSALIGGGNETTILGILKAFLIHGMIVEGNTEGGHYGPVAIGAPDERCGDECKGLGRRVAQLVKRLG